MPSHTASVPQRADYPREPKRATTTARRPQDCQCTFKDGHPGYLQDMESSRSCLGRHAASPVARRWWFQLFRCLQQHHLAAGRIIHDQRQVCSLPGHLCLPRSAGLAAGHRPPVPHQPPPSHARSLARGPPTQLRMHPIIRHLPRHPPAELRPKQAHTLSLSTQAPKTTATASWFSRNSTASMRHSSETRFPPRRLPALKTTPPPPFTQYLSPPRSLVRDGQTSPLRPRLVVYRSTCPPLSPSPHANSFVIGTAVIGTAINTHDSGSGNKHTRFW